VTEGGGFPEERHVAPVKVPEISEAEPQHCDPAHAKTPGKHGVVDADRRPKKIYFELQKYFTNLKQAIINQSRPEF